MPEKKNFVLRLDHGSYKALEKWASDEFRSVNGQIEFIVNAALKEQFGNHFLEKFRKPGAVTLTSSKITDQMEQPDIAQEPEKQTGE